VVNAAISIPIRFRRPLFLNGTNGSSVPTMTAYSTGAATANCYNRTQARDSGAASFVNTSNSGTILKCTLVGGDAVGDQIEAHWLADSGF